MTKTDVLPRRDFLVKAGALPMLGLGLADALRAQALAAPAAKGKSVLFIFLSGGPSHIDLWDMKPDAPAEIRGEFQPIATAAAGIRLCEHLPRLAGRTGQVALLRSLSHHSNDHEASMYMLLTGQRDVPAGFKPKQPSRVDFPSMASVAGMFLPARNVPAAAILPHLIIHQTAGVTRPGQLAGMMGPRHNPWVIEAASKCTGYGDCPNCFHYTGGEVRHERDPVWSLPDTFQLSESISVDHFRERMRLLRSVETQQRGLEHSAAAAPLDSFRAQAATLLASGKVHGAFDLGKEPDRAREAYGRGQFGKSLLLARRLLEAGVRLVQVNLGNLETWDSHSGNFLHLKNDLLPPFDQAVSVLLDDLAARGLLEETLLVLAGEFGRTPKVNTRAGRDHWGMANTVVLAGGGVRGGQAIGATDPNGAYPKTESHAPADLAATIYRTLGINRETEIQDDLGRPHVLNQGKVIEALFA